MPFEVVDKLPYRPIVNLLFAAESDRLSPCPLRCVQHDITIVGTGLSRFDSLKRLTPFFFTLTKHFRHFIGNLLW